MAEGVGKLPFCLFPVKVSVAATGWAFEGFKGALFPTCHELTTPISCIPAHACCMVLLAFSVPHCCFLVGLVHAPFEWRGRRWGFIIMPVSSCVGTAGFWDLYFHLLPWNAHLSPMIDFVWSKQLKTASREWTLTSFSSPIPSSKDTSTEQIIFLSKDKNPRNEIHQSYSIM